MANGVRIQPQSGRLQAEGITDVAGRMFVVRDVTRPLRPPYVFCQVCGVPHECKTYHLKLDGDGTVIVSETVWANLQRLYDCGGFEAVNVVSQPPSQGLILPTAHVRIVPASM